MFETIVNFLSTFITLIFQTLKFPDPLMKVDDSRKMSRSSRKYLVTIPSVSGVDALNLWRLLTHSTPKPKIGRNIVFHENHLFPKIVQNRRKM
jgi:hypothetical protein